jgi:alpha 1,3-glucosidase
MKRDPYTLYIALDQEKMATGTLYADDGHSFDHKRLGNYGLATFSTVFTSFIRNSIESPSSWASDNRENHMIERIIIMGVDNAPKAMRDGARSIDFVYDSLSSVITVRKPNVSAMENWMIELEF